VRFSARIALPRILPISASIFPATSGIFTLMSRVTVSVVTPSFSARTAVPVISPGLPGMVTWMSPCSRLVHDSDCTMSTSEPTNFLANAGTRSVGWL